MESLKGKKMHKISHVGGCGNGWSLVCRLCALTTRVTFQEIVFRLVDEHTLTSGQRKSGDNAAMRACTKCAEELLVPHSRLFIAIFKCYAILMDVPRQSIESYARFESTIEMKSVRLGLILFHKTNATHTHTHHSFIWLHSWPRKDNLFWITSQMNIAIANS